MFCVHTRGRCESRISTSQNTGVSIKHRVLAMYSRVLFCLVLSVAPDTPRIEILTVACTSSVFQFAVYECSISNEIVLSRFWATLIVSRTQFHLHALFDLAITTETAFVCNCTALSTLLILRGTAVL